MTIYRRDAKGDLGFDLAVKMNTIVLTKLNDFAGAYGNFTFEKETLAFTSELAASNGKLTGFLKPTLGNILKNEFICAFTTEFKGKIEPVDAATDKKRVDLEFAATEAYSMPNGSIAA